MTASRELVQRIVLAGVIVLLTSIAYLGSFNGQFVSDDLQMVVPNPLLNSLGWENIKLIFTSFDDSNYMPLKVLSLAVDRALWGPDPFGHHVVNLLLHFGCALTIFSILLRLGFSGVAACLVALLWAVHPLQVESVAWITERKNVLSGFFFFAAFRAYLEYSERPRAVAYVGTLLLLSLALLSKMNTLVLPAICLAYEATYKMRYRGRDVVAVLPMFALGALAAWYNLSNSQTHGGEFHGGSAVVTWLSMAVVVFRYLGHTILPIGLNSRYNVPLMGSPFDPAVFVSLLGLVAVAGATIWLIRRKKREAFWILYFAITLAPMLNIVPFRTMMQDRYMYLAVLGPLGLVGSILDSLARPAARRAGAVAGVIAVVACVSVTVRQVEYWDSPASLWVRDATSRPLRANETVFRPADHSFELAQLEAAVGREPDRAMLRNNLGGLHFAAARLEQAVEQFEEANRLEPDEVFTLINLGRAYTRLGRTEEAEGKLTRATELRPYNFMACYYLLRLHLQTKDASKARRTFDKCTTLHEGLKQEHGQLMSLEAAAPKGRR
jgi:hypothetical protein